MEIDRQELVEVPEERLEQVKIIEEQNQEQKGDSIGEPYPFLCSQTHYNYHIQYLLSLSSIHQIHYHNSGITTKITFFCILYNQNSRTNYNWYQRHEIEGIVEELTF